MTTKTDKAKAKRKKFRKSRHIHLSDDVGRITLRLKGDPILKQRCMPVKPEEITDPNSGISCALKGMMNILVNSKTGVGLSANQAGYDISIIIVKAYGKYIRMINPEVIEASDEKVIALEGCLSYPGEFREVSRHKWVEIKWLDDEGKTQVGVFSKMPGRIIQHELDHLIGICQVHEFKLQEVGLHQWLS